MSEHELPEALRIADWCLKLSTISDAYSEEAYEKAALEIYRLHAVNTKLLGSLESIRDLWERTDNSGVLAERMYHAHKIANRAINSVTK
jgi:hypothetical protein